MTNTYAKKTCIDYEQNINQSKVNTPYYLMHAKGNRIIIQTQYDNGQSSIRKLTISLSHHSK